MHIKYQCTSKPPKHSD